MLATEVIKKKRNNHSLSFEELDFFISSYTHEKIPDYQMASLLMAIFLNGMSAAETAELTQVMLNSGERVQFTNLFAVDKHSTGGVGDKTSLILGPIVAACGVPVPMMSGRGLGHTGGTLDKLESIPGFKVGLSLAQFKKQTETLGLSFIGQTDSICPADKKIYALRDVTATVESLPLICASIMSKKIAEGIKGLVLDVKFGSGAFMKSLDEAKKLASGLIAIGKAHQLTTKALLTNMDQPLGRFVGNALEIGECLSVLKQSDFLGHSVHHFSDTQELSLCLATEMIAIGKNMSSTAARQEAETALFSGMAYAKFEEVCIAQGGRLSEMHFAQPTQELAAKRAGFFHCLDAEKVGLAGIELKAGRKLVTDFVDPATGIEVLKKQGDAVEKGEPLFRIFANAQSAGLPQALTYLENSYQILEKPLSPPSLIQESLT